MIPRESEKRRKKNMKTLLQL